MFYRRSWINNPCIPERVYRRPWINYPCIPERFCRRSWIDNPCIPEIFKTIPGNQSLVAYIDNF